MITVKVIKDKRTSIGQTFDEIMSDIQKDIDYIKDNIKDI